MITWQPENTPKIERPAGWAWLRVFWRIFAIAVVMFGLLVPVIISRAFGWYRLAAYLVNFASRVVVHIMRFDVIVEGMPLESAGFIAANHSSWLDIFVINSRCTAFFVAKSEVRSWPMIGIFARAVGTAFIERKRSGVASEKGKLAERIRNGERLLIFPEGTSTDGLRVLPFRSSLFEAVFELKDDPATSVQGLSVHYTAPKNKRKNFYGWFGGMGFLESFLDTLAQPKNGVVRLVFHPRVNLKNIPNRKALAAHLEKQVRDKFKALQGG